MVSALAIRGAHIAALGWAADVEPWVGPGTHRIAPLRSLLDAGVGGRVVTGSARPGPRLPTHPAGAMRSWPPM